jgi:hypothetical protein
MADPYDIIQRQNPLTQLMQPNYNPLGSGNQALDTLFALTVPGMFGKGTFLPQQYPAQGILDQFISNKYRQSAYKLEMDARTADSRRIYENMLKTRSHFTPDPPMPLMAAQLYEGANVLNSMPVQTLAEMFLGPQMSEDIFFGRRGSKARLARGIGRIGFSRRDSISGANGMSADTLQAFSDQIYDNLYGPGTAMSDVAGFSAGRAGDILNELAQRGLLPQSASSLNSYERRRVFGDKSLRDKSFSAEINAALDNGGTIDEIVKLEGGGDAIRKIDATRVSNTLKSYTEALSSVREIFGDNGMSDAPMSQLIAAMDALTQNSMNSMSSEKITNIMRRTQMAARDAGVGLEGLMGLTARSGAIADQYGLSRSIASENVIGAMERIKSLEDTGGFRPGFGRMDKTKAAMFALDQGMRADSSTVGRLIGVVSRVVAESDDTFKTNQGKNLTAMVEALKQGSSTYFDTALGRDVNIYEEMGTNASAFFGRHLEAAGVDRSRADAYFRDPNTQRFMIANRAVHAQAYELKQKMSLDFAGNSLIADRIGDRVAADQKLALQNTIGQNLAASMIDTINTTMEPDESINIMQSSMERAVRSHIRANNAGMTERDVAAQSRTLLYGPGGMFKDVNEMRQFLAAQQAEMGVFVAANTGMKLGEAQQMFNQRGRAEAINQQRQNLSRATLFGANEIGDGSNFMQRLADSGFNVMAALGAIDNESIRERLYLAISGVTGNETKDELAAAKNAGRDSITNVFTSAKSQYDAAIVGDKTALVEDLAAGRLSFDQLRNRVVGGVSDVRIRDKDSLITTRTLSDNLKRQYAAGGGNKDIIDEAFDKIYAGTDKDKAAEITSGAAFRSLAENARSYLNDPALLSQIGLTGEVATEAEVNRALSSVDVLKNVNDKSRVSAMKTFMKQLEEGTISSTGIVDLFANNLTGNNRTGAIAGIEKAIENRASPESIASITKLMADYGLTAAQQSPIIDSIKTASGLKTFGWGMGDLTNSPRIARMLALQEQVSLGNIPAASGVGKIILSGSAEEKRRLAEDEAYLTQELDKDNVTRVDRGGGMSTKEIKEKIDASANELSAGQSTKPNLTPDLSNIGASISQAITDSVGPELSNAFRDSFKDLKLSNVTIDGANLDIGDSVAKALTSAMAGVTAAASAAYSKLEISGNLTIKGLDQAIINALPKEDFVSAPGGPSVVNT